MKGTRVDKVVIGTRQSALAVWQTRHVAGLLQAVYPTLTIDILPFSTRGDEILDQSLPTIGGKGVFTEALEHALRDHRIDYAVHSLKDMPTEQAHGLVIGAITQRADVRDVLISKGGLMLDQLPHGAVIGTSSRRRAAQIRAYRPDLTLLDIRGNVGTRIEKALASDSPYHALILASAGIDRLGLNHHIAQYLPLDLMLPAPGQGALAVQCRADALYVGHIRPIAHISTTLCVSAERAFLSALGGGCSLPVGAYASIEEDKIYLRGRVLSADGAQVIDVRGQTHADLTHGLALADELAHQALAQGAKMLVEGL
jgi:hydroxymethylbilane synthase